MCGCVIPGQRFKVEQAYPTGLMGQRIVEQPWTEVASDIMGPFPPSKSGYCYVLVFQDLFTKWIEVIILCAANGPSIKKNFEDLIVSRWGIPEVLHTDNGTEFCSRLMEQMCKDLENMHTTNPVYHTQANPTERVNRVLKTMVVTFLNANHKEWDVYLHEFRFAFNTAVHGSLKVSPTFLNFERQPVPDRQLRRDLERITQRSPTDTKGWLERER